MALFSLRKIYINFFDFSRCPIKSLLKLFPKVFFDNALTFAISSNKEELLPDIFEDIRTAISDSIETLQRKEKVDFNLQMQVASLIGILREFDEDTVVSYAKALIRQFPNDHRMLFELISVLGGCKTPGALEILEDLYHSTEELKEHTLKAIGRFWFQRSLCERS